MPVIKYKTGDILTEAVEALVNTVNCVGVMGRGVALQFKRAFPENSKMTISTPSSPPKRNSDGRSSEPIT